MEIEKSILTLILSIVILVVSSSIFFELWRCQLLVFDELSIFRWFPLWSGLVNLHGLEHNRLSQGAAYNEISLKKSLFYNGTTDHANQSGKIPKKFQQVCNY